MHKTAGEQRESMSVLQVSASSSDEPDNTLKSESSNDGGGPTARQAFGPSGSGSIRVNPPPSEATRTAPKGRVQEEEAFFAARLCIISVTANPAWCFVPTPL